MDDIGFHLDYGSEHWSVEHGTVVFERDLEPDEEYTTIYGIREYPEEEIEALRHEPNLDLIDVEAGDLKSVVDEGRSDVIRDFLSGDTELAGLKATLAEDKDGREAVEPAMSDPGPAEADDPAPTMDDDTEPEVSDEPPSGPTADAAGTEETEETVAGTPTATAEESGDESPRVPLDGGVVRVLIKELQEGEVDPEHRRILREELLNTDNSMEVRLSHLQQRTSDLEAYTDAMEQFLQEEGGAQAVLADLRADVSELGSAVESESDRLDEAFDRLEAVNDRLDSAAHDAEAALDRLNDVDDRLRLMEDDVGGIDDRVAELQEELESREQALRADIEALESDLDALEQFHDQLKSVFGDGGGPAGASQ
jgi:prefoldin subunit 5